MALAVKADDDYVEWFYTNAYDEGLGLECWADRMTTHAHQEYNACHTLPEGCTLRLCELHCQEIHGGCHDRRESNEASRAGAHLGLPG
jgi:hypothetical protein